MAKVTKQLPKTEQAKIKLELSNLVFSAEIKHQEMLSSKSAEVSVCTLEDIVTVNNQSYFNM